MARASWVLPGDGGAARGADGRATGHGVISLCRACGNAPDQFECFLFSKDRLVGMATGTVMVYFE
jgi:hypothetical protein